MSTPPNTPLSSELASLKIASGDRTRKPKSGARRIWILVAIVAVVIVAGFGWYATNEAEEVQIGYAKVVQPGAASGLPGLSGSGYVVTGDRGGSR